MPTFKTVPRPEARPCADCGGTMQPAKRYEATRTVDVHCCFSCGAEHPPLYAENRIYRRICAWCGVRYTTRELGRRACSDACKRRSAHYHEMMARQGQQGRVRPAS